jgi:UDP-N-acetylglucosamine 2-epimerase
MSARPRPRIVTVVGARPQFIKAAPLSEALAADFDEILVNTGQHYDSNMSDVFFHELKMRPPAINLQIGSGSHGAQTGAMLAAIEKVLLDEKPDMMLVYGDTNSTLAGALAAAKLHIPIAHVEAGLRSFNRRMPEEINRVLSDHLSAILFCTDPVGVRNLEQEGVTKGVHIVGDVMFDAMQHALRHSGDVDNFTSQLKLASRRYALATIHRAENTDDETRLRGIFDALEQIARGGLDVILPLHPRTRKVLTQVLGGLPDGIDFIEPASYFQMVALERHAACIITDSGGVQKEAWWLGVPCLTLRDETEWVDTVRTGWNTLAGADTRMIVNAAARLAKGEAVPRPRLAAQEIVGVLKDHFAMTGTA